MLSREKHFVAHNNSDDPRWKGYGAKHEGEEDFHWTRRSYREETLKGSKLWVIEGRTRDGSKRYELKCVGEILGIAATKDPLWRRVQVCGDRGSQRNCEGRAQRMPLV